MKNRNEWTAPLIERLTDLWQNHSAGEIAAILNKEAGIAFSRNAIIGKVHKLGLSIENKNLIYSKTRENGHARTNAIKPKVTGKQVGSLASGIIHRIKAKQSGVGAPDVPLKPQPDATDAQPRHITLMELSRETCRWPYGDPSNFTFCGCDKISNGPYCYQHDQISKPPPSSRKALPGRRAA
jgi:GcrA cell cycle regulator